MTRYAVLAGCSEKEDFRQKSLCDMYTFLKSFAGGAWADKEILILPAGVNVSMLKLILRRIAESGTDFLFLYFCGNGHDRLTADGFTVGATEIKRIYIEETCENQVAVFDACENLVSDDAAEAPVWDAVDFDANAAVSAINAEDVCRTNGQLLAAARILGDEALGRIKGSLWLSGCTAGIGGERPVLGADGSGVYTAAFTESLGAADTMLDFTAADRNARFACSVVHEYRAVSFAEHNRGS
ncbi:hypothetical protein [Treponema brennaborense]|uniref:Peptidase C14 caspase catalytic subunit p20 n=1 Tax=Treponema brennaborense (strain DSM 12168 / CIP 105900 / DD5/3) TaxID=906968 RepID=F4LL71_TREBD|nr:hypothetical protein [Treponema brennaborense]AEE17645.1 hypothetical protein Trebr_2236 [Treponema brennaborense DSM 12168]